MEWTDQHRALYAELRKAVLEHRQTAHIRALLKEDTMREAVLGYALEGSSKETLDEPLYQELVDVLKIAKTEAWDNRWLFDKIKQEVYIKRRLTVGPEMRAADTRIEDRACFLRDLSISFETAADVDSKHPEAGCRLTLLRAVAEYDERRLLHTSVGVTELPYLARRLQRTADGDDS